MQFIEFANIILNWIEKIIKYYENKSYADDRSSLADDATSLLLTKLHSKPLDELEQSNTKGINPSNPIIADSSISKDSDT